LRTKAGERGADREHEATPNSGRQFGERQGYGGHSDLAERLAQGLEINDDAHGSASDANAAGPSESESGARFSVKRSQIQLYLDILEENLDRGEQLRSTEAAKFDNKVMPDSIALANKKRPGLNVHFVIGADAFAEKTLDLVASGVRSFRIVVRTDGDEIHFVALDVNNDGWRTSVIAIEPALVLPRGPNFLAPRCAVALKAKMPDAAFLIVDSQMQSSGGECGTFSLFLVKAMFKAADDLKLLHEDNVLDRFHRSYGRVSGNVLPPRFMKHAQSRSRVEKYFSRNKKRVYEVVNKRGEALGPRFMRHFGEWSIYQEGKRRFSRSIEVRRIREYQALLNAIDEENQGQS
jgi:YopJ family protease